jgi:hypothetical protein
MTPDDVLARIINHGLLLEEAKYVKNLSKGIVSAKRDDIALKAIKKGKKEQMLIKSSSEEAQEEEDEDEEKEYDENEITLLIKKFNKYTNKRRLQGRQEGKSNIQKSVLQLWKEWTLIDQCPYERREEDDNKKKNKDKSYKKEKKFFKKKTYGEAHIGQEWDSDDDSSESESEDMATVAIKGKSS